MYSILFSEGREGSSLINDIITKEQFDLLFHGKDFVFFMKKVDNDFEYIYINDHARQFMQHDVVSKKMSDILSKETFQYIAHHYELAIRQQQAVDYEDYMFYLSELRKCETTVKPIFYEEHIYLLSISKEITVHKDIEENFVFMRSSFHNSFFSAAVLSKEGFVIEVNPKFTTDFGIAIENVTGQLLIDLPFIHPSSVENIQHALTLLNNGESISVSISSCFDSDGHTSTYLMTFISMMQENAVAAIFLTIQKLTDYRKQQQQFVTLSHQYTSIKEALNLVADIAILNEDGILVDVNEEFLKSCKYTRDDLIGKPYQILLSRQHATNTYNEILTNEIWRGEICYQTKYGENYWVDAKIIPLKDAVGVTHSFLMVHYNISDKKMMMTELQNIEHTFKAITENTNDLIVITNEDGIILYTSPSYSKRLGYSMHELVGHFYDDLIAEQSRQHWQSIFHNQVLTSDENIQLDLQLKTKEGQYIWTEGLISIVQFQEQSNRFQYVMVSREVTQRKEKEKQLEFLAFHDSLTMLPNRRFLMQQFPTIAHTANMHQQAIAVLFVDGDNFKVVNDQYGHDIGDAFIKNFGEALSKSLRSNDLVIRLGGDEFIVVLTNLTQDSNTRNKQIIQIIQRMQVNMEIGWDIQGIHFTPTSSVGIACFPEHSEQLDVLIDMADKALYEAKKIGKNSYKFADTSSYA